MKTALVSALLLVTAASANAACVYTCDRDTFIPPAKTHAIETPITINTPTSTYSPPAPSSVPFTAHSSDGKTWYYGSVNRNGSFDAYSPNQAGRIYGQIFNPFGD